MVPPAEALKTYGLSLYVEPERVVVPLTLEQLKTNKLQEANQECDKRINVMTISYPATELMTFSKQENEARQLLADSSAVTPMLDAMSHMRGVGKFELAQRIITKADIFSQLCGIYVGHRQRLEDLINSATTEVDLNQIDVIHSWPLL
jgi:hypothetical protein